MKKLICDICGLELTDKADIELAIEGQRAWELAARARGAEPRGVIPCQNFVRCGGEIKLVVDKKIVRWSRSLTKLFS